jgi:hypothetical protein
MNNLSKYEKLQHRHLTLLNALAYAGISASCKDAGPWEIANCTAAKPIGHVVEISTLENGVAFDFTPTPELSNRFKFADVCRIFGVPLQSADVAQPRWSEEILGDALRHDMFVKNYSLGVSSDGSVVYLQIGRDFKAPIAWAKMTPLIRHLLDALEAAIVPASPAKVD